MLHQVSGQAAVPAARTAYARIYVSVPGKYDRKYFGLYSMVENIDNIFLRESFGQKGGALFKPVTPFPFTDLGPSFDAYQQTYDPKTGSYSASILNLVRLGAVATLLALGGIPQGMLNLICTNVPGPMIPLYSVGHRLLEHYPMVPLAADFGIGVGITSFDKGLYLGIMCDPQIVDDVDKIAAYAAAEFRALREAAGVAESDLPDIATPHKAHRSNGASAPPPGPQPETAPAEAPQQPSTESTPVN